MSESRAGHGPRPRGRAVNCAVPHSDNTRDGRTSEVLPKPPAAGARTIRRPALEGRGAGSVLTYNNNRLYARFSGAFSNWSYVSKPRPRLPARVDRFRNRARSKRPVRRPMSQISSLGSGVGYGEARSRNYAYNGLHGFDYTPYVPGLQAAAVPVSPCPTSRKSASPRWLALSTPTSAGVDRNSAAGPQASRSSPNVRIVSARPSGQPRWSGPHVSREGGCYHCVLSAATARVSNPKRVRPTRLIRADDLVCHCVESERESLAGGRHLSLGGRCRRGSVSSRRHVGWCDARGTAHFAGWETGSHRHSFVDDAGLVAFAGLPRPRSPGWPPDRPVAELLRDDLRSRRWSPGEHLCDAYA